MTHPNASTALARVVIDELAAGGVRRIFGSPGSRNGALLIAAAGHPQTELIMVIDERSAAYHALGAARSEARPSAVICTSGTAVANLFPAVVEADMSCVPLVAVSANRPERLRGVGANQTIDQSEIFGRKVRAFAELDAEQPGPGSNLAWRDSVSSLLAHSTGPTPGPVHLDVAFEEPTVPVTDDGRTAGAAFPFETPPRPDLPRPAQAPAEVAPVLDPGRGLVIAGDGDYDRPALLAAATAAGWPVLATALSGLRGSQVVSAYHRILRHGTPSELVPRTVVAVGSIGPDDRLERLIAEAEVRIRVDRWGRLIDPGRGATSVLAADAVDILGGVDGADDTTWAADWLKAEDDAVASLMAGTSRDRLDAGADVAELLNHVPWETLVVGSSLPIREVDAHLRRAGPVFANRGASGIDGVVSTAFGVASTRERVLLVVGDLSLLHDSNAFLHDRPIDLTVVVMDNRGGGLFDSLPQARHAPDFERLFVTPPNRDLSMLAGLHGARFAEVSTPDDFLAETETGLSSPGAHVIRVPLERSADLERRRQIDV